MSQPSVTSAAPPPSEALEGLLAIYGQLTAHLPAPVEEAVEGAEIGHFVLQERIAEGGMGVVWRAEQTEPVHREVAVKIIKPGLNSEDFMRRFRVELESLARLEHPHIARVYDAGITPRGRPFLVMELLRDAAPVTDWCRSRAADLRTRLELFARICATVQFAHQRGVIHRDLKPSNLLVSDEGGAPRPVVIDFGVARAAGPSGEGLTLATEPGRILGTPAYMSPEQAAAGDAATDTRSDVYALGCVLYELVTGEPPFDHSRIRTSSLVELARLLREEHPPTPSDRLRRAGEPVLAAKVRGELNWIVMKALAKEPAHRYASALALEEDVRRYLRGDAVLARPASLLYRARKFAARHKSAAAAAAAALVSLLAATGISLYQARRETRERQNAEAILRFFDEDLVAAARHAADAGGSADPLDAAARRVAEEFADRPVLAARLRTTLGRAYLKMGDSTRAAAVLPDAYEILLRELGPAHSETLRAAAGMAEWKLAAGDAAAAVRQWRAVLAALSDDHSQEYREAALGLATALARSGDLTAATPAFDKLLADARRAPGSDPDFPARAALGYAAAVENTDAARSDALIAEALAARESRLGPGHAETLAAASALARIRERSGDSASALTLLRNAYDGLRTALGPGHPKALAAQTALADASERLGDEQTALDLSIAAAHALASSGRDTEAVTAFFHAARLARHFHRHEQADRYRATGWSLHRRAGLPLDVSFLPRSRACRLEENGHWYQRVEVPMSWPDADAVCRALGGHLATLTSPAENDFVYFKLAADSIAWLGAQRDSAGQWSWITGEPFDWTNWAPGEPSNWENVERCLNYGTSVLTHFRKGSQWNDHHESGEHSGWPLTYPVCEWEPPAQPPPFTSHAPRAASLPRTSLRHYECTGHWYARINVPMTWTDAAAVCAALGGSLALAGDEEENGWLYSEFATDRLCWLGVTDRGEEGVWKSSAGTALTYLPFASGEPNNTDGLEHFVNFGNSPLTGIRPFGPEWNDASDEGEWLTRLVTYPICEWPARPATLP